LPNSSTIKLLIHLEVVSAGGTIHNFRQLLKYIDKSKFELYFATTSGAPGSNRYSYLNEFLKYFDPNNVLYYPYRQEISAWNITTKSFGPPVDSHELYDFIEKHSIQVLYGERGGESHFPFNKKINNCKIVSTNIWGGHDPHDIVDYDVLISQGVRNTWMKRATAYSKKRCEVIGLLVDDPESTENKREDLGIDDGVFVVGRIGNKYVGDTENMYAYDKLEKEFGDKVACVWLNPSDDHRRMAQDRNLKNLVFLPLCTDYVEKSQIINTFDVFTHDRAESFGAAIAECIIHKKPVITTERPRTKTDLHSAHVEFFNDPSYLTGRGGKYYDKLKWLYEIGPEARAAEGQKFYDFNYDRIAAQVLTQKLERIFESLV
jgi:hypothetical protein